MEIDWIVICASFIVALLGAALIIVGTYVSEDILQSMGFIILCFGGLFFCMFFCVKINNR